MGCITQIAAIKNASAIWEYDPSLPGNHILGGSLNVIAAICMIAVKVVLVSCFPFRLLTFCLLSDSSI